MLRNHQQALLQLAENHVLNYDDLPEEFMVAALVTDLYGFVHNDTTGRNVPGVKVGLKDPWWRTPTSVEVSRRYFPRTKLVFGMRHPVTWFQR